MSFLYLSAICLLGVVVFVIVLISNSEYWQKNNQKDTANPMSDRVSFGDTSKLWSSWQFGGTLIIEDTDLVLYDQKHAEVFRFPAATVTTSFYNELAIESGTKKYSVKIERYGIFANSYLFGRYEQWMKVIHEKGGPDSLNKSTLASLFTTPSGVRTLYSLYSSAGALLLLFFFTIFAIQI